MADPTGFDSAPEHYAGEREAIDIIRDEMSNDQFVGFCYGAMRKYELRSGKKLGSDDMKKALWFRQMLRHARAPNTYPDPRSNQPGFKPYERQAK